MKEKISNATKCLNVKILSVYLSSLHLRTIFPTLKVFMVEGILTLYQIFPFGGNRAEHFIVWDLHKGQPTQLEWGHILD